MTKKIKIVSVSQNDIKDSLLFKNLNVSNQIETSFFSNNKKSLASIYNSFITDEYKDYILLFVHDDAFIADNNLKEKVLKASEMFDVFGIAGGYGGIEITNDKPALWHLISKKYAGFAGHYDENEIDNNNPFTSCWMTSFGKSPQEVNLLDGLIIGVNVEKALKVNLKFDEKCPSRFHFYDLLFSVNCKIKGLKLGVFPFNVFHQSPGLKKLSDEFIKGDQYFKNYCKNIK
jgi:hypothetical protein